MAEFNQREIFEQHEFLESDFRRLRMTIQNPGCINDETLEVFKEECERFESNYLKVKNRTIELIENAQK